MTRTPSALLVLSMFLLLAPARHPLAAEPSKELPSLAPTATPSPSEAPSSPQATPSPSPSPSPAPSPVAAPSTAPVAESAPARQKLPPGEKVIMIQIGAFQSARKAAWAAALLEGIGPSRVERIPGESKSTIYRVLVGDFRTLEEARTFVNETKLKALFPSLWINAVQLENQEIPSEPPTRAELARDPYFIQLNLHCDEGRKAGETTTLLQPESDAAKVEYKVSWSCIPDTYSATARADMENHPNHWSLAPQFGIGSLSTTNPATGNLNRSTLAYGASASYHRNWGGIGAFIELRALASAYSGDVPATGTRDMLIDSELQLGGRIVLTPRLELEPWFGGMTTHYLLGTAPADVHFEEYFQYAAGLRATWALVHLSERGSIDLTGGIGTVLPLNTGTLNIPTALAWNAGLSVHRFFNPKWSSLWSLRYESISQSVTQGATSMTQAESRFVLGFTVSFAP